MEFPENRGEEAANMVDPEPVPKRGFQCKWCKQIGPNPVRRTYEYNERLGLHRKRFCLKCRREYDSWEK